MTPDYTLLPTTYMSYLYQTILFGISLFFFSKWNKFGLPRMNNSAEPDFFASHLKIVFFLLVFLGILRFFILFETYFYLFFSEILSTKKYVLVLSKLI